MHDFKLRVRRHADEEALGISLEHPRFSHGTWVAVAVAGAGLVGSVYGASQQAKAVKDTNAANQASVTAGNTADWNNYLLSRGVNAGGAAAPGTIPSNAIPTNTRLPLWMNVQQNDATGAPLFIKKGAQPTAPSYALSPTIPTVGAAPTAGTAGSGGGGGGGLTNTQKVIGLVDPGMALIGGKNSAWYDPIGLRKLFG
jgi:hypothetical protein